MNLKNKIVFIADISDDIDKLSQLPLSTLKKLSNILK